MDARFNHKRAGTHRSAYAGTASCLVLLSVSRCCLMLPTLMLTVCNYILRIIYSHARIKDLLPFLYLYYSGATS